MCTRSRQVTKHSRAGGSREAAVLRHSSERITTNSGKRADKMQKQSCRGQSCRGQGGQGPRRGACCSRRADQRGPTYPSQTLWCVQKVPPGSAYCKHASTGKQFVHACVSNKSRCIHSAARMTGMVPAGNGTFQDAEEGTDGGLVHGRPLTRRYRGTSTRNRPQAST